MRFLPVSSISAMTRWALDSVHCASMSTASVLPMTITDATANASSSQKKTLVASGPVPLAFSLISMRVFSRIDCVSASVSGF